MAKEKGNKKSFFSGLKTEWGKITWTGRADLAKQTGAVVVISAVLAFLITLIDTGSLALIEQIIQ